MALHIGCDALNRAATRNGEVVCWRNPCEC
jgi:hypothetical protein